MTVLGSSTALFSQAPTIYYLGKRKSELFKDDNPKIQPYNSHWMRSDNKGKRPPMEKLRKNHWGGRGRKVVRGFSPISSPDLNPTTEDTTKFSKCKPYPGRCSKKGLRAPRAILEDESCSDRVS